MQALKRVATSENTAKRTHIETVKARVQRGFRIVKVVCRLWLIVFRQRVRQARAQHAKNVYRRLPDADGNVQCRKCERWKAKTDFSEKHKGKGDYEYFCRNCKREQESLRRKNAENAPSKPEKAKAKNGHKFCRICGNEKPIADFRENRKHKDKHYNECRVCENKKTREMRRTFLGSLGGLLKNIRTRSRDHKAKGKGGVFDVTIPSLIDLYEQNYGRCEMCGLVLGWAPHSENRMTCERKNSRVTYTMENISLIALRFNTIDQSGGKYAPTNCGSGQWSKAKWIEFHVGYKHGFCPERDRRLRQMFSKRPGHVPLKNGQHLNARNSTDAERWCTICGWKKPVSEFAFHSKFSTKRTSHCRPCAFIQGLLKACKHGTNREMPYDLTDDLVRERIIYQNGLCLVSCHEMSFEPWSDYKCSIERRQNSGGHTADNIYLVCIEFQTPDASQNPGVDPDEVVETAQWTQEIYERIFWPTGIYEDPTTWKTCK